jgi:hypothetical protein
MPNAIRRSRTISLRLSEAEYEAIVRRCRTGGGVHLSDLVRTAVSRTISEPPESEGMRAKLSEIDHRLEFMDHELKRLYGILGELGNS